MKARSRQLLVILAVCVSVSLVTGTGAISAAQLQRGVSVDIAERPSQALVGIYADNKVTVEYRSTQANTRDSVTLLKVANNLGQTVEVDVKITGDTNTPPNLRGNARIGSNTLDPGKSTDVLADVTCGNQSPETWTVTLIVTGGDVKVIVSHDVKVVCEGMPANENSSGQGQSGQNVS